MKYEDCLPVGLEFSTVHLYLDALRDKFLPIFGDTKRALNAFAKHIVHLMIEAANPSTSE